MIKTVKMGGRECVLRTSAALPRRYRVRYNRDIFTDLNNAIGLTEDGKPVVTDSALLEDIVYTMHQYGDPTIPEDVDAWLELFEDPFAIINAASDILDLWVAENVETSESKKKDGR